MTDRRNHYEAAFEAFLRDHRIAYVAVDETRRSLVADGSLKSLDFIVSTGANASWLVDVKGRRFPSGDESRTYWKNWSTRDDLRRLAAWQSHFGPTFCPILVFAYHLVANRSPLPTRDLFRFRGAVYGFLAVPLADYVPHARTLSESWDTVALPTAVFRRMARPWSQIVAGTTWVPSGELVWQELSSELQ